MASEIRVNKLNSQTGVGTITLSPTGVDISGVTTASTLRATTGIITTLQVGTISGDGSALTGVASTENIRTNTNATFLQNVNVSGTSTIGGDVNIADKIVHIGDTDTAIRFSEANQIQFETAGVERLEIQQSEAVFNDGGADFNFRVEGDTDPNLLHIDASADAIGVGAVPITTGPKFEVTRSTSDDFVNATDCVARLINSDTSRNTNQTSLQFTTSTTSTGADSAIVSQAEDASGNSNLQFWTDTSNGMTKKLQINSSGDLLYTSNNRNYAFWYKSPTNSSSNAASTSDEVLTFGTAILANSAYSTSNGRYTAPIDGLYFIRFNGLLDNNASNQGHRATIYVNGSQYGDRIAYQQTNSTISGIYHQMSGTGIVYMSANDYAQIHCTAGIHVSGETQFLGYLIRATV